MTARHAAPGRRWAPAAYRPGRHRYRGSVRQLADQHTAAATDLFPTVPLPFIREQLAALANDVGLDLLPWQLAAAERLHTAPDFRRARPAVGAA